MANILYDGRTKTNINSLPEEAWTYLRGGKDSEQQNIWKRVPWLYRGVELRSQAVAQMPFGIYKGETEIDDSEDYQNKIEILPSPARIFKLVEMSNIICGYAYLFRILNKYGYDKGIRYLVPTTIKPDINDEEGLVGFKRTLRGQETPYKIEDIIHFWMADPYVEIGPPASSAGLAALAASGVLMNADEFAEAFFERGAIKATILSVPQGTSKDARTELKKWYSSVVSGIKNAFATEVVNADVVTATTIGEGMEGLENTQLTKEKREDISTALGIPQSIMFSSSATDSNREEDAKSFYQDTIVPQVKFIQEVLNNQLLIKMGYRLKFKPETLAVFQEDEEQRSGAFMNYRMGGLLPSVTAEMLGLDLPDGVDYKDLDANVSQGEDTEEKKKEQRDERKDEMEDERGKFHRYMKNDKDPEKFTFNFLPITEQELLKSQYAVPETDKLLKSLTDSLNVLRGGFKEDCELEIE